MAVLAMKRIDIYALKANRKKILETLQLKNAVEIRSGKTAEPAFSKTDTSSSRAVYEKNAATALNAVGVIDALSGETLKTPSMFQGRTKITDDEYYKISENASEKIRTAANIVTLNKKAADLSAQKIRYETQIESLLPWMNLDISMRTTRTKSTQVFIGSIPEQYTEAALKAKLAELLPDIDGIEVEIVSSSQAQTCVFVLCHTDDGAKTEAALRLIGFSYPTAPSKKSPKERVSDLEEKIKKTDIEMKKIEAEIRGYSDIRQDLIYTSDYYLARAEKYRILGDLWQSKSVFQISGFIPSSNSEELKSYLENTFDSYVELSDPSDSDDVPVALKNNAFAAPVEGVLSGYSLPKKGEIDPSFIMSLFYYFLFGMMLSDAAYGILMTVGCAIILMVCKNMEPNSKKSIKMFMYCGISTTFWGILFGSYFGDVIQVIARVFFNKDIVISPLWFTPLDEPMRLLLFSLLLGVIHLFAGLAMLIYTNVKNKQYKDAIYDGVFWYFLVGGLIIAMLSTDMFKNMFSLSFQLPGIAGTIALVFVAIGAVGIVATAGRESKNPFKRLLKGLYGLYNISGYLSDILSYSRLLALGLATGVIATVFNSIGEMVAGDGGVVGAIAFALVFIIGHGMNLAINALGAYVHTNRLQYVEFFGKFYEGGGKKFEPFSTNTKYIKVTEEKENGV